MVRALHVISRTRGRTRQGAAVLGHQAYRKELCWPMTP
jgi:hypothetical protein